MATQVPIDLIASGGLACASACPAHAPSNASSARQLVQPSIVQRLPLPDQSPALVEVSTQTELFHVSTTQRLSCHPVENDGENGDDGECRERDPTGAEFPRAQSQHRIRLLHLLVRSLAVAGAAE